MQLRKKIICHLLLATYILVVLHQSTPTHDSAFVGTPDASPSHKHENFEDRHHDHHFHIGIFHYLGHLFENINHSNDFADEHLVVVKKSSSKKIVDYKFPVNAYIFGQANLVFVVDAESLPAPPFHLSFLQQLKLPGIPLRAPPSFVYS